LNRGKLVQFTLFIFALILFICLLFGASHFLYYEFLFQASMLDLLTLTRVMALRNLVAIIFCTVWFVSCWTNVHASDDRNQKLGLLRFTFFFGQLLVCYYLKFIMILQRVYALFLVLRSHISLPNICRGLVYSVLGFHFFVIFLVFG
jgi:hypothetical protein